MTTQPKRLADSDVTKLGSLQAGDLFLVERDETTYAMTGETLSFAGQFDTVAAMVASNSIAIGDYVLTRGYTTPGDGGHAAYLIVAASTGTVDGGSFIDLTGIAGQARLVHNRRFHPKQWGAAQDGVTDDAAKIQAMIDFGATVSPLVLWSPGGDNPDVNPIIFDFGGGVFAVGSQITLSANNSHCIVRDATIIAIAGSWSTSGTEIVGDLTLTKDDYIFKCQVSATYISFENPNLNCNGYCGGLFLRSRCFVHRPNIKKIGYTQGSLEGSVGIYAASGDVHIRDGWVGQWDQNDVEYYDKDAYSAIGIFAADSDLTVIGTKIRWCYDNVLIGGTNSRFVQIHSFNGQRSYTAADRGTQDATFQAELDAYFGFDTSAYDFPARTYHAGVRVLAAWDGNPGRNWDNTFDDCYFDNCHFELESDGVRFNNPKLGAKNTSSISTIDYWWKCYAHEDGGFARLGIHGLEPFVESKVKDIVQFVNGSATAWSAGTYGAGKFVTNASKLYLSLTGGSSDGTTPPTHSSGTVTDDEVEWRYIGTSANPNWDKNGNQFEALDANHMDEDSADNFYMRRAFTNVNTDPDESCVLWYSFGTTSTLQFGDDDTTQAAGALTAINRIGSQGDDLRLRASNGAIKTGNTASDIDPSEANAVVVSTGDSTVTSVGVGVDNLVIENNADVGISLCSPAANEAQIAFYDPGGKAGFIGYDHATDDLTISTTDNLILVGLPTSSAGLPTGAVWNDSGTLKIV